MEGKYEYKKATRDFLYHGSIGFLATSFVKTIQYPFVQTHLYSMGISNSDFKGNGWFALMRHEMSKNGISYFYRGHTTTLLRMLPSTYVIFGLYKVLKENYKNKLNLSLLSIKMILGSICGVFSSIPIYINSMEANKKLNQKYKYTSEGKFNGQFGLMAIRYSLNYAFYLGVFDHYRTNSFIKNLIIAYFTSSFAAFIAYPLDTIFRWKFINYSNSKGKNDTYFQVIQNIYESKSFYKGGFATITRSVTTASIIAIYNQYLALNSVQW